MAFMLFTIVTIVIFGSTECYYTLGTNETEAAIFVRNTTRILHPVADRLVEAYVALLETDPQDFNGQRAQYGVIKQAIGVLANISKNAKYIENTSYKNSPLSRAIEKIQLMANLLILDEDYQLVIKSLNIMRDAIKDKTIPLYNESSSSDSEFVSFEADISEIITVSKKPDELLYYWKQWRQINEHQLSQSLGDFIELLSKAGKIMGESPLKVWYINLENERTKIDMGNVMKEIMPFYQHVHAFVRRKLYKDFGPDVINSTGPIPYHIFEQVVMRPSDKWCAKHQPYPEFSANRFDSFVNKHKSEDYIKMADTFYSSLGLEPLPAIFWERRLRLMRSNGSDCQSIVLDPTPNSYMFYCNESNFQRFLNAHQDLGRVYYAHEKENILPIYFDSYPLEFAVGKAVALSASSLKHLTTLKLAPLCQSVNHTNEFLLNRLFFMAFQTIFQIPINYVHNELIDGLLSGNIKFEKINENYWQLMYEFVGVSPPDDRSKAILDLPPSFYSNLEENRFTRNFIRDILGYQFYRELCKRSKHEGELHKCDFYGSRSVGHILGEMMKLGSGKSFEDIIGTILPRDEKTLSGDALFEYYAPFINWLQKENNETKEQIGWKNG